MTDKTTTRRKTVLSIASLSLLSGCATIAKSDRDSFDSSLTSVKKTHPRDNFDQRANIIVIEETPSRNTVSISKTIVLNNSCQNVDYNITSGDEVESNIDARIYLSSTENRGGDQVCAAEVTRLPTTLTLNFDSISPNEQLSIQTSDGGDVLYETTAKNNRKTYTL